MYEKKLIEIGLNKKQAKIYSFLIKNGGKKGSEITKAIKTSRQLTYKLLDELEKIDLISRLEKKSTPAIFLANHPNKLEELLNKKERKISESKKELSLVINNLVSDYNLFYGQPGVQVFEGVDGVKKVLADSLKTKGEILTYADVEPIIKHINEINQDYVKKRIKLAIKKRALVLDTPFARKYMKNYSPKDVTDTRFLSNEDSLPFSAFVEIYDDKISYITFDEERLIGIIIQNKSISDINKYLFEFAWKKSKEI